MENKGLVIVLTGDGKGKTTSALGMLLRMAGHDKKACVIQFMKSSDAGYGEFKMMDRLDIENHQVGAGCTWTVSKQTTIDSIKEAWNLTKQKVLSDGYDCILLDELNIALSLPEIFEDKIIDTSEVIHLIQQMRQQFPKRHLIITGRYAVPELIEEADLVSEIKDIKHPYTKGIKAQKGIEF